MSGMAHGVALTGFAMLAVLVARLWRRRRRQARLIAITRDVTRHHARLLSVRQRQLVAHDGYGNYQLQPWIDHVDYFIEHVVLREVEARGIPTRVIAKGTAAWSGITRALLAALHAEGPGPGDEIDDADVISGEHYETLCRALLEAEGWRVDTTPASGDQGADLIASRAGRRIVIQCKFHARPVGNKAVQEAHAGLGFHAGDAAVVVSNAAFTRSAQQLARANGVLLMHHRQLAALGTLTAPQR